MDDIIMQLGVGGGLAWLIIKEVLDFLSKKNNPPTVMGDLFKIIKEIKSMTRDLHDWHNHDDPLNPGSKVWYGTATTAKLQSIERQVNRIVGSCGLTDGGRSD